MPRAAAIFFISLLTATHLNAQVSKTEMGFGLGAFNYTGDLSRKYHFTNHRPGATAFYKYHINSAVNFRAALTGGYIFGSDAKSDDPFASQRGRSFRTFAVEVSTVFEYNFIDLKSQDPTIYGTPYLFGGIGIAGFSGQNNANTTYSPIQPVLPFGAGVKYNYSPHWYFALEVGTRFLFFDYLDGVSYGDPRFKDYQYGNWYDNDRYYFISLTATYAFYKIPCPTNPY